MLARVGCILASRIRARGDGNERFLGTRTWLGDILFLIGTAPVTLIGLLFVAVTMNIDAFRRRLEADVQLFGVLTFNSFFYVLILAILFVIPGQTSLGLGVLLFALGFIGFFNTANQFLRARRIRPVDKHSFITLRFIGPMLCLLLLVGIAIGIMLGYTGLMYGLVAVVVYLLGSASQNAWALLMRPEPKPAPTSTARKAAGAAQPGK